MKDPEPVTEAMYCILLAMLKPGHGYGMMQRIKELSGRRLVMGPGTSCGVLNRMLSDGWIVLAGYVTVLDKRGKLPDKAHNYFCQKYNSTLLVYSAYFL